VPVVHCQADLLIAMGVRFDDRVTGKLEAFAQHARIVHIDIDPAEIDKNKTAHIPICAGEARVMALATCRARTCSLLQV
jgi:thiamine pyrophosphate-dependent acetolactate synthase large subunit-like protein